MEKEEKEIYHLEDVWNCYDFEKDVEGFYKAMEPSIENTSFYAIEEDGCLYHYCGNTRIKVHEHFSDQGKSVSELIENVILHTAKKTA